MMRRPIAVLATALLALGAVGLTQPAVAATPVTASAHAPLTNLTHLNSLLAEVAPPAQAGHTTYRLAAQPAVGTLWVYADHRDDGSFHNTGGGAYDAATNTYGQGAYDADDIARAAVVYLRQWRQRHDEASRQHAVQLLRGLTYLQTASGPNAGNVVLWMQPDGTLNPSPTPPDSPNPADSGASFWLARTIWALGEGYADLRTADPAFAAFLRARMELAVTALHREVLTRYGVFQTVHGRSEPAWLIGDGADASAEAVLGLSSYVRAGGSGKARTALAQLADGIARLGAGNARTWPYGAVMPSAVMPSDWHAWASQMPAALATAAAALHRPSLLGPATADAATFTPHLLTATGPSNGWLPAPADNTQIAYGVDSRVQSLLAVADATGSRGLRAVAGIAAGWFFGANNAGVPTYDPATGVGRDGVDPTGKLNLNSGAESTIHALLTMQALDARPDVARQALAASHLVARDGTATIEAESAQLAGPATATTADPAWTGEALYSGGAYVDVAAGASLTWTVPASRQNRLVQLIVDRRPGPAGTARLSSGSTLGSVALGGAGVQGAAPAPDELVPVTVTGYLPAGATTVFASVTGGSGRIDALQLSPLVSSVVDRGADSATELLSSQATRRVTVRSALPTGGPVLARSYDARGRLAAVVGGRGNVAVTVPAGGFAVVTGR